MFDSKWIARNFPDAEVRRQRAAYRRGVLRSALVATGIVAAMSYLVLIAVNNARSRIAEVRHSQQIARDLRRNLYAADLSSAQAALDEDNTELARALLEPYCPKVGQEDLRTFEWSYLWEKCRDRSIGTITVPNASFRLALSPDGRTLANGGLKGMIRFYDMLTHCEMDGPPPLFSAPVCAIVYSPDGHIMAVQGRGGEGPVVIWDLAGKREIGRIKVPGSLFGSIAISPNSRVLAATSTNGPVTLWDLKTLHKLDTFAGRKSVVFSPDGKTLVTGLSRSSELVQY